MPTPTKGPRLGGGPAHERLILANLATSLFEHGKIMTTEAKARRLRPLAERLITKAKRGDLHARRQVMTIIRDKTIVHELFTEIGPRYATRQGGYTRIIKVGPRKGDNAPMAVIELVEALTVAQRAVGEAEGATKRSVKESAAKQAEKTTKPAKAAPGSEGDEVAAALAPAEARESEPVVEVEDSSADGPYGPGSAAPLEDGSAPDGFTVKGNADSMMYHTTESRWYEQTVAEAWFVDAAAAEAAGFSAPGAAADDAADSDAAEGDETAG